MLNAVLFTSVFGKNRLNANTVIRGSGDVDGVSEVDAPLVPYSNCETQVTGGSGSMLHEVVKRLFHLQHIQTCQTQSSPSACTQTERQTDNSHT